MSKSELVKSIFQLDHMVRSFWSFVIAGIFFGLGIWFNSMRDPSRVIVLNTPDLRDTVVLRMESDPSSPNQSVSKYLLQLSRDVNQLRRAYALAPRSVNVDRVEPIGASPYSPDKRPIKLELMNGPSPMKVGFVQVPSFSFPEIVKGYIPTSVAGIAKISLASTTVRKGANLDITFELLDTTLVGRTTPILVELVRKDSDRNYTQMASQQYVLPAGCVAIRWPVEIEPGNYELSLGFSLISELDKEYPQRYSQRFPIAVRPAS